MRYLWPSIDLRPNVLRAVRLAQDSTGVHLANYVETPLAPGLVSSNAELRDEAGVASAIASALRTLGFRSRFARSIPCVTAIPAHLSAIGVFERDEIRNPRRARRNAILSAAEFAKEPPLDVFDRCSVSVEVIGPGAAAGKSRYLIIKTLRDALTTRLRAFRRAGCTPVVEHEAFALLRAIPYADAIVDIGARGSLLVVPTAEGVPLCRSFAFGGDAIVERVSRGANMELERAQARVFDEGVTADDAADWLLNSFVDDLAASLTAIANDHHIAAQRIVLTGASARVPGVRDRIGRKTLTDVAVAELAGVESAGIPPMVLADLGPVLSIAVGLALWSGDPHALASVAFPEPVIEAEAG
jgi:Tfp pilus assembly PilM family ATPase